MNIEIKNIDGAVLYTGDFADLKAAAIAAVKSCADLYGANLYGANLSRANLSGAKLSCADLSGADLSCADLSCANLSCANLSCAGLSSANLSGANLYGANLSRANLSCADLSRAKLSRADLSGANLSCAKGINPWIADAERMMLDQPGPIRRYKLVRADGVGPYNGGITYEVGKTYEVPTADTDESVQCAEGINLATLQWCVRNWETGRRILLAEFTRDDIAAIPFGTDGKFRVRKCTIVGEKDLTEIGLVPKANDSESAK